LDRLCEEEPQCREPLRHGGCGQLSLTEQIRLVLANVFRSELIGRAVKVPRKILDRLDVAVDGSLSVITTLEFFEHHFAKVGHRESPYDPTLSAHTPAADIRHAKASAAKASFKRPSGKKRLDPVLAIFTAEAGIFKSAAGCLRIVRHTIDHDP